MPTAFTGLGSPMSSDGLAEVSDVLGVHAAEIWAVLTVETRGCGFLDDRRPLILFERHVFSRQTKGRFDAKAPEVSQPNWGGYGAGGKHQYDRLSQAIALDRTAALRSASWGIGQVMGFHAESVGYPDVEAFVAAVTESEDVQLEAMAREIVANRLDRSLRSHDWSSFARGYNGPLYAQNQYDIRLASAYQRFERGLIPDLALRKAQVGLFYLGFDPGPIDGVIGRKTRSALMEWQQQRGLSATGDPEPTTLARLSDEAFAPRAPRAIATPVARGKRGARKRSREHLARA